MKEVLKVTFAYLAAVIGAGFATGSEAVLYFVRYGKISFLGLLLTSIGFGIIIYTLLSECVNRSIDSFENLLSVLLKKSQSSFINVIMMLFMIIMLGAMISGFAEMMQSLFGFEKTLSSMLFAFMCAAILMLPDDSIIKWGGYTGMFIVVFIYICSVYMINSRSIKTFSDYGAMSASAIAYTAYNAFAVCPVICKASSSLNSKKQCIKVGVLSGVFSFVALLLIWCLMMMYYNRINLGAMPMITLAARQGRAFCILYSVVVFAAILSSAVANAYGISLKLSNIIKNKNKVILYTILPGWFVASVSFTDIVDKLYRYLGFVSVAVLIIIIIKIKKNGDN